MPPPFPAALALTVLLSTVVVPSVVDAAAAFGRVARTGATDGAAVLHAQHAKVVVDAAAAELGCRVGTDGAAIYSRRGVAL